MIESRGYYEAYKIADLFGLPVTVMAGNVIYNGEHYHDHVEILYCKRGSLHVRVNGAAYHLQQGDFITINSGANHEIYEGARDNLQIICSVEYQALGDMEGKQLACVAAMAERAEAGSGRNQEDGSVEPADAKEIQQALGEMAYLSTLDAVELWNQADGQQKAAGEGDLYHLREAFFDRTFEKHPLRREENWFSYHMYMYQLLRVLVKYKKPGKAEPQKKKNGIQACVSYIHEHLGDTLSAEILAEELHVSMPTIYRLFSKHMGMHLGEYITNVRLNAACRYLEETGDKVIDIAYHCGFSGLSNFYRIFKQQLGVTPKDYRKACRQGKGPSMLRRADVMGQTDIMKLNQFQEFSQLGYEREVLRS